jgi:hypothetical protein
MTSDPTPDFATPRPEPPIAELDEPPCQWAENCCHGCSVCSQGCRYDEWMAARAAIQGGSET